MKSYLDLLAAIVDDGDPRPSRGRIVGTTDPAATRSLFGQQLRVPLAAGFPLLTTKTVNFKAVVVELLWFLRGQTNVGWLNDEGVHIWDEWADEAGDLGPVYGRQWRGWPRRDGGQPVDQIARVVDSLRADPFGRRHIVSAWNVGDLERMRLPPCHLLFQFHVDSGHRLHCQVYQRSADVFLGLPFNIASYALLTHMVARHLALGVGDLVFALGDVHLYDHHMAAAIEQLLNEPRQLPKLELVGANGVPWLYEAGQISVVGYNPHGVIKAKVVV